ncbi:MAG TPA: MazG family protein [Acidimicrobiales bacterium]|nr:MazG family protein [Acidimicrobiales bacterium]
MPAARTGPTRPRITVVGLGPAGEELIPPGTLELLASARTVFLRTSRHPSAAAVLEASSRPSGDAAPSSSITTLDHHYDEAETFDEVYERIVADLVTAAQVVSTDGGEVVYAVPGSPFVAERTVELLRADKRVDVTVVPAMSFLDLAWARLGIDPISEGVRLVDGTRFAVEAAGERGPLLVAQCWSPSVLSEVKLALGDVSTPHDVTVTVLHHLGLADEAIAVVPWHEIDRAAVADHLTSLWVPRLAAPVSAELAALDELVRRLRRDCPWDRQQTHASLERHLLEEAYEVLEAIDALGRAREVDEADVDDAERRAALHLEEELGDLLFQVFFHSRLAAEEGRFTIADVARGLHDKLVSRHPHVFGDVAAHDAATVVANWEEIKKREKGRASVTDGIPAALPSLALAAKLQRKSHAVPGAAIPRLDGLRAGATALVDQVADGAVEDSGADQLNVGVAGDGNGESPTHDAAAAGGALLWAVADLVRRTGVEPEDALRAEAGRRADELRQMERQAATRDEERTSPS